MSKQKAKKIIYTLLIFLVLLKAAAWTALFFLPSPTSAAQLSASQILQLTNQLRQQKQLNLLKVDAQLTQAAYNKAQDILTKQYIAHFSPTGKKFSDFAKEVGYDYFLVGENLALNFTDASAVMTAWEKSPTHLANLINPNYQEIGLAVVSGQFAGQPTVVVVQIFGSRTVAGITTINPQALTSPVLPPTPSPLARWLQPLDWTLPALIVLLLLLILAQEFKLLWRHFHRPLPGKIMVKT